MTGKMTILRLKLDLSKEQAEQLMAIAKQCRRAKRVSIENWLLRQRGFPLSEKQAKPPQPRRVRDKKTGEIKLRQRETSGESTKIYHSITAAEPSLDTNLASALAADLYSLLKAKVDWRLISPTKEGENGAEEKIQQRRKLDEILNYEQSPPWAKAIEVPTVSIKTSFVYGAQTTLTTRLLRGGEGVFTFTVLTSQLGPKIKAKLLAISSGDQKLADSYVRYRQDKNQWYWYLPVREDEAEPLDPDKTLELFPQVEDADGNADRPFCVGKWHVGDGRYLLSMLTRITAAEKEISAAYRNRRTGAGHGRKKRSEAIAIKRRQKRHQKEEFRRRLIRDIVNQCQRHLAGTLVYHEPSLPLRKRCWFERKGIEWDWTRFGSDLKNAANGAGVKIKVKMFKWKDAFPDKPDEPDKSDT